MRRGGCTAGAARFLRFFTAPSLLLSAASLSIMIASRLWLMHGNTAYTSHQSEMLPHSHPQSSSSYFFCTSLQQDLHRTCTSLVLESQLTEQVLPCNDTHAQDGLFALAHQDQHRYVQFNCLIAPLIVLISIGGVNMRSRPKRAP